MNQPEQQRRRRQPSSAPAGKRQCHDIQAAINDAVLGESKRNDQVKKMRMKQRNVLIRENEKLKRASVKTTPCVKKKKISREKRSRRLAEDRKRTAVAVAQKKAEDIARVRRSAMRQMRSALAKGRNSRLRTRSESPR